MQTATSLPFSVFRPTESQIDQTLETLKSLTENWSHPWFITHVRSHSGLPGMIANGNDEIDKLISVSSVSLSLLEQARSLHTKFHMSASSLKALSPDLSMQKCKHLVHACKQCAPLAPLGPLQPQGVNPHGLTDP